MIVATDIELRAGARLLMEGVNFRVAAGDRIGLVGRNGGQDHADQGPRGEGQPASGTVTRSGEIGYLPQDPRAGDPEMLARDRILAARGLDAVVTKLRRAEADMASDDPKVRDRAMDRYTKLDARFEALGGYTAESEAARICANLNLPERILTQQLKTLSGGQRRRVELARILFSASETLLLDEPTNHLDADSITWLREHLKNYAGGLIVISHDVELLEVVVNRVFHLDANRATIDLYNVGWKNYLKQRETDEKRRQRERANAEKKAGTLLAQAAKMGAKATKAVAAQNMAKRARAAPGRPGGRPRPGQGRQAAVPQARAVRQTPLMAEGLSKSYGSLEIFTSVDLAIDRGSRVVILGLNGAGKTTLLRMLGGVEDPDTGQIVPGHGLKVGYYAQEHETLDHDRTVLENMRSASPDLDDTRVRTVLGSFLFSGDDVDKPAGVLSGGEKTRLALATRRRLQRQRPAPGRADEQPRPGLARAEILDALKHYEGAVVLVTHDEGAVEALGPERVVLCPTVSRTCGTPATRSWWRSPDRARRPSRVRPGVHS